MSTFAWVYATIAIFNPIVLSPFVLGLLIWILARTGIWRRRWRIILLVCSALYAVDTAFALPRIIYAWRSPTDAVIKEKIPLPASLVLLNAECGQKCHELLLSGALDEVILVRRPRGSPAPPTMRYRVGWSRPGACPQERRRAIRHNASALLRDGFCPLIEPAEIPSDGIFIVQDYFLALANNPAAPFQSEQLTTSPPGDTIEFRGVEVQRRAHGDIEVLAARRKVMSPGLTGLPPLVGCWARPDNVIWIMPPGDTKCGFWRWFTWGGDQRWRGDAEWAFVDTFAPPERSFNAPQRPQLPPVSPTEALEILAQVSTIQDYVPGLKEALVAPSVSDDALANLVVQRASLGALEGSLIDLLATERPAAALMVPGLLNRSPRAVNQAALVVSVMERNRLFFDSYRELMFDALSADWRDGPRDLRRGNPTVERFLAIAKAHDSEFLCQRLDRVTSEGGLIEHRDKVVTKNYFELIPHFLPPLIRAAAPCGERGTAFMRELLASPVAARREEFAWVISRLPADVTKNLVNQTLANLVDDRGADTSLYKRVDRRRRYVLAHVEILLRAGYSCDKIELELQAAIKRKHGATPPPQIVERLTFLDKKNQAGPSAVCTRQ